MALSHCALKLFLPEGLARRRQFYEITDGVHVDFFVGVIWGEIYKVWVLVLGLSFGLSTLASAVQAV